MVIYGFFFDVAAYFISLAVRASARVAVAFVILRLRKSTCQDILNIEIPQYGHNNNQETGCIEKSVQRPSEIDSCYYTCKRRLIPLKKKYHLSLLVSK